MPYSKTTFTDVPEGDTPAPGTPDIDAAELNKIGTGIEDVTSAFEAHAVDSTGVHGIADTSALVTTSVTNALDARLDKLDTPTVTLTDAATVVIDATSGPHQKVTVAGNRTIGKPSNGAGGQRLALTIVQDGTGSRAWTLHADYRLRADDTVTPSTSAGARDELVVQYDSGDDKWDVLAFLRGDGDINTGTVDTTDVGYDIVLLLGQSNMSGCNTTGLDLTHYDTVDPRVQQFGAMGTYNGLITQAYDPLIHPDNVAVGTGLGPGTAFARWYLSTVPANRRVLLVPAAYGGSALSTTDPVGWRRSVGGNLYASALSQALAALTAAGANARIVAALWVQGESDALSEVSGSTYQTDLDALVAGLRTDLSLPSLPFIIGQMVPDYLASDTRQEINDVHAATPYRLAYTAFAPGPTSQTMGDGNHYSAAGMRLLGRALLDGYLAAVDRTTPVAPPAPTGLDVSAAADTSLTLVWTASAGATSYIVEKKLHSGSTWSTAGTPSSTSQSVTGLTAATSYDFRVSGVSAGGTGTASATFTRVTGATGAPAMPTGLAASSVTATTLTLTWDVTSGATSYIVEQKLHSGSSWSSIGTPSSATQAVTGLTESTSYDFRVSAVNGSGTGAASPRLTQATTAATISPSDLSGLYAWWKADAITGLSDGAAVASWTDSSGGGFAATQSVSGSRPVYKTNIVNGKPVVRLDGVDDSLDSTADASLTACTMFVVWRPAAVDNTYAMLSGAGGSGGLLFRIDTAHLHLVKQQVAQIAPPGPSTLGTTDFVVAACTYTDGGSGTYAMFLNGGSEGSGSHGETLVAGRTRSIGGTSPSTPADFAEVVIYNRVLNSTERGQVTTYLGTKYAITVV